MKETFEEKIAGYCKRHEMISHGDGVLVALSGGGDSVGLLHVLVHLRDVMGITVEAAHLNHSLRGEESDRDELFCRELCASLNIYMTTAKIPESDIAARSGSIETFAREKRHIFLEKTMIERTMSKIATGHTIDDQAETILQRLFRGTGPLGLQGILPTRDNWIRPLLCVTRSEIRDYLTESGSDFCEDSSNGDTVYFRNRIRHDLIPFLQDSFSPNITGVLQRLAELSRVQEEFMDEQTMNAFKTCRKHADPFKILLDKPAFMGYHKVLQQRAVRHCLEILEGAGRDTDMDEIENILNLITRDQGVLDITAGVRCESGKETIVFTVPVERYDPVALKLPGDTVIPWGGGVISADKSDAKVNVDGRMKVLISAAVQKKFGNLSIGPVKRGEFMTPYGKERPVKIRDIMSAASLPKVLRDTVPVVRAGATAVWIPGLKSSEYLRAGKDEKRAGVGTKSVLLRFKNGLRWS